MDKPSFKGHRVLRLLGEGGMGRVYLAKDETLGRHVAIKVISERRAADAGARARFLREARSMATVEHPNVVRVYSFGETAEAAYFVMEYVEGEMLAVRLRRGRLPVYEALRITHEVVLGLEAAWEKNVVHRDVKPTNILLDQKGRACVADFGLAKPIELESDLPLTATGSFVGSPHYISPEQARGREVDFRSDIYATGIVLYEMLAGHRPYEGKTPFEVVAKHLNESLPSLADERSDLPGSVVDLVEWMTAKDAAARPSSYSALRTRLEAIQATLDESASASTLALPARRGEARPVRRRTGLLTLAGLVILAAVAALWPFGRATTSSRDGRLAVAVTPFFGPDDESAREGRMMAALVERAIDRRLPRTEVRLIGIEETKEPVRGYASARALAERLGADVVVWGDCLAFRGETEIQPYFTMVPPSAAVGQRRASLVSLGADPLAALQERAGGSVVLGAAAPNQIEMRKTSAAGVGDLVLLLAGVHALYVEGRPQKALSLFDAAPRSSETLRYRAEALLQLRKTDEARRGLEDATALAPKDPQAWGALGDLHMGEGRFAEAVAAYRRASEVGGSYSTRNAILFDGKLYAKETFPSGRADDPVWDSGYLLELDPDTGSVQARYHLAGVLRSLHPQPHGLAITYWDNNSGFLLSGPGADDTVTLSRGRFDRPLSLGSSLRLRRQGAQAGLTLAANFMGPEDEFKPSGHRSDVPGTFPDLEAALRHARERDSTQPWYLFLDGQAAWWQGRRDDAAATWKQMFAGAFAETPYYEYAWMAFEFERYDQSEWADRAFEEALRRRQRLPEPITFTVLIDRLIVAPFGAGASRRLREGRSTLERAHAWLLRARQLVPLGEGDDFAAAAWARYFRRRGEDAKAAVESVALDRARASGVNMWQEAGRQDEWVIAFAATSLALWLSFAVLLNVARRRLGRPGAGSTVGATWVASLGALARTERHTLLVACVVPLLAYAGLAAGVCRMEAVAAVPIGYADSLGSPGVEAELERRLATVPSDPLRFLTAVANHLAGNVDRARELYRELPLDARAQKNLEALESGSLRPPAAPTADDVVNAYITLPWSRWIRSLWDLPAVARRIEIAETPCMLAALDAFAIAAIFVALLASPGAGARRAAGPVVPWRRSLAERVVPGWADLGDGSPVRGWLTLVLFAFFVVAAAALAVGSLSGTGVPAFGPMVTAAAFTLSGPFPLPPSPPYWLLLFTYRDASWFWAAAVLSGVSAVALQAAASRRRRGVAPQHDNA